MVLEAGSGVDKGVEGAQPHRQSSIRQDISIRLNCICQFVQLILRQITKILATRYHISKL